MSEVVMSETTIDKKVVAIVRFGPETVTGGMRPAEYYQVTIDPKKVSPNGEFIRFGLSPGDEIVGWQRVKALTVLEILGEWIDDETPPTMHFGNGGVTMLKAE